ncbi:sensor histidine kinase [Phytohalomonas tamaricis]|uniref:sensor histidine kinase n=1 Tax=Phytohalomonas tamaricis TaxID=2081032 RepID=UPI000D0B865A|nr:HAMP domain-containing sensor histidine kinase [Phytohalomonas tamaricis]
MANQASRRWRPRSLPQLILLAFAMVMLPIAVLIFQAGQALSELSELSELADVSARQAVDQTRRARELSNLSLSMERSARQYAVLEDSGLMTIYAEKAQQYGELLDAHARLLEGDATLESLRQQLNALQTLPQTPIDEFRNRLTEFTQFSQDTDTLVNDTARLIDARIDNIRARAREVKGQLWLQTTALVSLSLLLILFFTWLIIRPIRQLERRILSIGSGGEPEDAQHINGPAELVNLGERLSWLSSRLQELEAQKQQFLRHMSHELKTPLASIREGAGLLADGIVGELTPRQREIVLLLDDSSQELQTLIEQLLDYNLLQQNRRLMLTKFDLITVVQEVISKHRLALEQKGMEAHWLKKPIYWHADRVRTARILDNLVSNAIAYGEDGGKLWIRARVQDERYLVVEVANTGTPITENDRPRLFEPFYQGGARRKGPLKGSGIGLSVAAESALAQQGTLALVDDENNEADVCFRLTLPWVVENDNTESERVSSQERTPIRN